MAKKVGYGNPPEDTQFKKGQSGNPNGRPKKTLSKLITNLKEEGYEEVKPIHIKEAYTLLMALDDAKIEELRDDPEQSRIVRAVAKIILLEDKSFDIIERMLDRAHGKPAQAKEEGESNEIVVVFKNKD